MFALRMLPSDQFGFFAIRATNSIARATRWWDLCLKSMYYAIPQFSDCSDIGKIIFRN